VNGVKHGTEKEYYESGVLRWETPRVNGYVHGIVKLYHESGAIYSETPYVNGNRHGIEKRYDSDKLNIDVLTLYKGDNAILSLYCEGYNESSI
jgi:antitoxin component YwqK of YwqJK toxin-antitoxin module